MIGEWLVALEATAVAGALRSSVWAYPLVNAVHILGVALLVGAMLPLDLRLLGAWRSVPLAPLWRVLTRTASAGLGLAMVCGTLLFITRATEYAASGLFISKTVVVGVGTATAVALRTLVPDAIAPMRSALEKPPVRVQLAGGISLAAWLTALLLGRLVGYF
jgi:hypothetical protein